MTMSTTQTAWEYQAEAAERDLRDRKLGKALIARELQKDVKRLMEEAKRLEEGFAALNASEDDDPIDFLPVDLGAHVLDYDDYEAVELGDLYSDPEDSSLALSPTEEYEWRMVLDAA